MKIEVDERGGQVGPQRFEDADGYVMPLPPASGPRRIPLGDFPAGPEVGTKLPEVGTKLPEVGTKLPEVVAVDQHGRKADRHSDRGGQPAVLVFYRPALW